MANFRNNEVQLGGTCVKRSLRLVSILAATVLIAGCSYRADFVLVNDTEEVLTVQFFVEKTTLFRFPVTNGGLATIEQHEADFRDYDPIPEDRVSISSDRRFATVLLMPKEVLLLVSRDIRDISDEPVLKSGISRLSIRSSRGVVKFEGDQIFKQFEPSKWAWFPDSPLLYTLRYH